MSKKFRVIMAVLAAVVLLATVGVASVAMADEPEDTSLPPVVESFLARVAGILGITEEELLSAVQQARQEMREEWRASNNCTATDNRTICQNKMNRFRERVEEKQQKWAEKSQQWQEKKQQRLEQRQQLMERWQDRWHNRWFQDDGTASQTTITAPVDDNSIIPSGTVY